MGKDAKHQEERGRERDEFDRGRHGEGLSGQHILFKSKERDCDSRTMKEMVEGKSESGEVKEKRRRSSICSPPLSSSIRNHHGDPS
jgi:hypothetical protein